VRADIEGFLESARGTNSAWDGAVVLPSFIRRNIKLAEAPSYGKTIFEYDPDCNGADDYRKVGNFFLGVTDEAKQPEAPAESQPEPQTRAQPQAQPQAEAPAPVPIEIREIPAPASQSEAPVPVASVEQAELQPEPQPQTPVESIPAPAPIEIREVHLPAPICNEPTTVSPEPSAAPVALPPDCSGV
ncbi:MAG: hypothetical protein ABFE01_11880, partial [Phycisphaerales bacterium]